MLEQFGRDGMSSDESLIEHGVKKYSRLVNEYRAPEVTSWLRVFDRAREDLRRGKSEIDQRGRSVRVREDRGVLNPNPRIPEGLPLNAFSGKWFRGQNPIFIRSHVRPSRKKYSFSHNPEFLQYVDLPCGLCFQLTSFMPAGF